MSKRRIISLVLAAALMVSLFAGCAAGNEIKVGTILPITGPVAEFGTQDRDAMLMAFDEINKAGGVLNKQLKLVTMDDKNDPTETKNAFVKLQSRDKVAAILGGLTSGATLAITKDAQDKKMPLLTPTATNVTVTDAGDFVFRACFLDDFQGKVVARFAVDKLKATKAAILFDNSNDYSKGLKDSFSDSFKKFGGTVVATESYNTGDKDFSAQLTKIKALNPDVLFLPDYYNTVGLIAKQVKSQGIKAVMLGADGWDSVDTDKDAAAALEGSYFSNHYSPDANDPDVKKFVDEFKTKYKKTPNALAALGYDAAKIIAEAIKKAGSTDPEKIKAALKDIKVKGVTGDISFDAKRNPIKPAYIVKVTGGQLKYETTINYADAMK